ncbi:MAG: 2Fe-2S iron-sulfur cluster-binding protein, partial [Burkholderiaceae bacterium]|nr:2Fe-2S iron-sulfur cluster-binding protein [Burkholderiaceae bacterium]
MKISLSVNGLHHELDVEPDAPLSTVLREQLGLTGTKESCSRGECGACTVLVGGRPMMSCLLLAARVRQEVSTIEALAEEALPLREAFAQFAAFQCGFCTSGQIVRATALLRSGAISRSADPEGTIRREMSGNLCRCTG